MINTQAFYAQRHGHPIDDVTELHNWARARGSACVFFAGDGMLDGKHFLFSTDKWDPRALFDRETTGAAPPQYASLMIPPRSVRDVAFWLNRMMADANLHLAALNLAVDGCTILEKNETFNDHDLFIRENIREDDVLVVSIGCSDILLRPSLKTTLALTSLLLTPSYFVEAEWAPGLSHLTSLFKRDVERYARLLTEKRKPRAIIVCMMCFPDESDSGGGGQEKLSLMGYNRVPGRLQRAIGKIYDMATTEVDVPGTTVRPVPLFRALDGKNTAHYVARVGTSSDGNRAIAAALMAELTEVMGR